MDKTALFKLLDRKVYHGDLKDGYHTYLSRKMSTTTIIYLHLKVLANKKDRTRYIKKRNPTVTANKCGCPIGDNLQIHVAVNLKHSLGESRRGKYRVRGIAPKGPRTDVVEYVGVIRN